MGTHPIFESDFDCLTETMLSRAKNAFKLITKRLESVRTKEELVRVGTRLGSRAHYDFGQCFVHATFGYCGIIMAPLTLRCNHTLFLFFLPSTSASWTCASTGIGVTRCGSSPPPPSTCNCAVMPCCWCCSVAPNENVLCKSAWCSVALFSVANCGAEGDGSTLAVCCFRIKRTKLSMPLGSPLARCEMSLW